MGEILFGVLILGAAAAAAAHYMFGSASYGTKRTVVDTIAELPPGDPRHPHGHVGQGFCGRGSSGHW